ncbi:MAG TPA: non-canonical purine NTP pyrophosphatase [Thermoplasmata archaeon]|jgi:XTP/dITP diphosphohydrolase|nr:non-canonical purine NTP pyrophosphatase [Thermoplasmata archaeon]
MDVTFVTSNPGKVAEARRVFAEFGIGVRWSRRELPEPQSDRLEDVVRAKLAAATKSGRAVVVEDSGIFVPSLGGFPGVYSRNAYDTIGLPGLLRLVAGRPRRAEFRAVAGYRRGRTELLAVGRVEGTLSARPRGSGGFGYDPVFVPRGERRTFAEMAPAEKDALSHRGRAMRALARKVARVQVG